ncbi:MAG: hypothetical protein J0L53_18570 [Spirochaetes bacterium]|nr:hypothetical protein [Spirochaetota bacterium]MBX3721588.1 hypothetical protein [Turneriella sp.]
MRKMILAILILITVRAQKPPLPGTGKAHPRDAITQEQLWAAEKIEKQLEKEVATKHKGEVKSDVREGPFQTLLVRAYSPGAYPGTGVMSVIVARNAVSYGIHGERDFADFVRAQGWLKAEPDVEDYMRVLDYAQFEAVVMHLSHLEAPVLRLQGDALVLHFMRGFMPGGAYATEVVVAKTGPVKITQKGAKEKGR